MPEAQAIRDKHAQARDDRQIVGPGPLNEWDSNPAARMLFSQ